MTDDLDMVAAEYVLGTLDLAERSAFAERLRDDPLARQAVSEWERRLGDLPDRAEPVAPPPDVWAAIERAARGSARMHTFKVIDGGGRGGASAAVVASRNRWRAGALISGAVAAALLIYVGDGELRRTGAGRQTYLAVVNRGGDKPALLVSLDLATHSIRVRPVASEAPPGKSLQLWYVAGGAAPRSLGLVGDATRTVPMPSAPDLGATFAVSVEPPGGSRSAGPSGPVVYSGQLIPE